ncbi:MAG: [protein-PII] uridylyltransferase [Nitrospira sp.]|nr:[protein-PII] uridylyltransferase [Nitrospira sp.]
MSHALNADSHMVHEAPLVVSQLLAEQRQAIQQRLLAGASGEEVVTATTDLVDGLIVGRYRTAARAGGEALTTVGFQQCCLVAIGGYGRRELAPHSDIDLMFLFHPDAAKVMPELVKQVLHPLWDSGFQVGHSVRTIQDCIDLGLADLTVRTSMMEARFLAGSPELFQQFHARYVRKVVSSGFDAYLEQKVAERQREYQKFGETVYLLEPNVNKSQGGLRDLHLLQWIGSARFHAPTIRELSDRGILSQADYRALKEAREFLLRVRSFLHIRAGMAQEILTFDEQVWLANQLGFTDRPHLLAVEQFMQQYYRHTMGLHAALMRFVERCRRRTLWQRVSRWLPAQRIERYFAIDGEALTVPAESRSQVLGKPALLLTLFDLARSRKLSIDPSLLEDIHRHAETLSVEQFHSPETGRTFLSILAGPGTAKALESMHRAHLLEKLVPAFSRVRGLMQFNQYHKYTVDEHSLLAVAKAEALAEHPGVLGDVYREIKRKDLLHLALLLHDLGKGHEEDHSEVGKRLAEETAARLGFDERESRTLVMLVHRHLLMAHTAFRRDPYDEKVLLPFAREVGTPEVLRKLLALTAADIAAVGPDVLTKWKESLLVELYLRAMQEVSGERETADEPQRLARIADDVVAQASDNQNLPNDKAWIRSELEQFPLRYAYGTSPRRIAVHLGAIRRLQPGGVVIETEFNAPLGTCEYAVIAHNDVIPGLFSKIAGVMAAGGLQILDAQIVTRRDGVVVDTFQVADPDYQGEPPMDRRESIAATITDVLTGRQSIEAVMRRGARLSLGRSLPAHRQPAEVRIDNETSDRFTILDVFADDRQGLLYIITNAIFQLGLSVHASRISTRLDQVADVFYVTSMDGKKVEEVGRLETIRASILNEIEVFLGAHAA